MRDVIYAIAALEVVIEEASDIEKNTLTIEKYKSAVKRLRKSIAVISESVTEQ